MWARNDRDFTVPGGISSRRAISACVRPSKCCSRTTSCSSGGSSSTARRTSQTLSERLRRLRARRERGIIRRDGLERGGPATCLAAVDVDRRAPRDRREPRSHLAILVEAVRGAPRLHERLLGRLLGEPRVAEHPVGDRVHEPSVCAVDDPNRVGIPVAEPPPDPPVHTRLALTRHRADATSAPADSVDRVPAPREIRTRLVIRTSPYPGLGMARTRLYREGKVVSEDFPVTEISDCLREPGACVWLDFCSPTSEELASIAEEFQLHPLAVEDAGNEHERPKLDRYDTHLFLSAYAVELDTVTGILSSSEIDAFVMPNALVTVRTRRASGHRRGRPSLG